MRQPFYLHGVKKVAIFGVSKQVGMKASEYCVVLCCVLCSPIDYWAHFIGPGQWIGWAGEKPSDHQDVQFYR